MHTRIYIHRYECQCTQQTILSLPLLRPVIVFSSVFSSAIELCVDALSLDVDTLSLGIINSLSLDIGALSLGIINSLSLDIGALSLDVNFLFLDSVLILLLLFFNSIFFDGKQKHQSVSTSRTR